MSESERHLDEAFRSTHRRALARAFRRSKAKRLGLSEDDLAGALQRSVVRSFPKEKTPTVREVARFLDGLALEDVALARACELGNEGAWQQFVIQYRPILFSIARRIVDDSSRAIELADGLHADLYGAADATGKRRSLLAYFHGRSRLSTWLRAVLARRAVDLARRDRREEPLDPERVSVAENPSEPEPERERLATELHRALSRALSDLEPRDRLRLGAYYLDGATLAEVGRITGEHESTVSRRIARVRRRLSVAVERALSRAGLSKDQIRLAWETALETGAFDVRGALGEDR